MPLTPQFTNELILEGVVDYLRNNPNAGFLEAHAATMERLIKMIHGAPLDRLHPPLQEDVPTREDGKPGERHPSLAG